MTSGQHDEKMPRVLELAYSAAAAYCGRLLRLLGGTVCAIDGDRRTLWASENAETSVGFPEEMDALVRFLMEGKRVGAPGALESSLLQSDIVLCDFGHYTDNRSVLVDWCDAGGLAVVISNFGFDSDRSHWKGGPLIEFHAGGEGYLLGAGANYARFPERPPVSASSRFTAYQAGLSAAVGALALWKHRTNGGNGNVLNLSSVDTQIALNHLSIMRFIDGVREDRNNRRFTFGGIFECADGYVEVLPLEQHQWVALLREMTESDAGNDPRFATSQSRAANGQAVNHIISQWTRRKTRRELLEVGKRSGCPIGPYYTVTEAKESAQFKARQFMTSDDARQLPFVSTVQYTRGGADLHVKEPPDRVPLSRIDVPDSSGSTGSSAEPAAPLSGVRVADFSWYAAGPYCTLTLAMLGADVVRIESGTKLDSHRKKHFAYGREYIAPFDYLLSQKKSISLNLKHPGAVDVAKDLIGQSDVVVENYRPGVMERLGLGFKEAADLRRGLVYLSLTANGQNGPDRELAGYAPIFSAMAGLGLASGFSDGPPLEFRNSMDHVCGLFGALAIVAEMVRHREESVHIDLANREVAAALLGEYFSTIQDVVDPPRSGNQLACGVPYGVFPTKGIDQWIAVAVINDEEWFALCREMGRLDWGTDSDFASLSFRFQRRFEIEEGLTRWTRQFDKHELANRLQEAGIAAYPSMSGEDLFSDQGVRDRGMVREVSVAGKGKTWSVGSPWRFQRPMDVPFLWSPEIGEHNREILPDLLHMDSAEIDQLNQEGALD